MTTTASWWVPRRVPDPSREPAVRSDREDGPEGSGIEWREPNQYECNRANVEVQLVVKGDEEEWTDNAREAGAGAPAPKHAWRVVTIESKVHHFACALHEAENVCAERAQPEARERRALMRMPRGEEVGEAHLQVPKDVSEHHKEQPRAVAHAAHHDLGREEYAGDGAHCGDVDDQRLELALA
eukprot:CAMPEP_0174759298 /NCGR_PEP_ID=MMETSP1094-20130205/108199_1 /TAXON_ID=156173 /ORGANISM="Chrysochromulina brevifilum, Strain UTEX LB 985" /LENGTH=182 /DNA_ID=CAMNT_0015965233 /DNA_START=1360 /DNA_END=1906 /DNA_ORIENTATION=+